MNNINIRMKNSKYLYENGLTINPNLPLLERTDTLRNVDEIINRSLALSVVVACSFGFDKKLANEWLKNESISKFLTQAEICFLNTYHCKNEDYQLRVEALHAFAWLLGKVEIFSPFLLCESNLVKIFPNLKQLESSQAYRKFINIRNIQEVIEELDKLYCLHSAIIDNSLHKKKLHGLPELYVIEQRRYVLEWVTGNENWEEISLDT